MSEQTPASPEGPDEALRERRDLDAIEDKIADPWSVACPRCGAAAWTSCTGQHEPHVARSALAVLPLLTAERERGQRSERRLAQVVERVEALCDNANGTERAQWVYASDLRAALSRTATEGER